MSRESRGKRRRSRQSHSEGEVVRVSGTAQVREAGQGARCCSNKRCGRVGG